MDERSIFGDMLTMDHSMGGGMMGGSSMKSFRKASGADFDKMFLKMMIQHMAAPR